MRLRHQPQGDGAVAREPLVPESAGMAERPAARAALANRFGLRALSFRSCTLHGTIDRIASNRKDRL